MIAEGRSGPAGAAIQGVADDTAPARVRRVDPQIEACLGDVLVEIEVADSRLHQGVSVALVDFEYPVHALEVEHHAPGINRSGAAIGKVAAGGDGIERDTVLVCGAHHGLHLFQRCRRDRGGSRAVFGLTPEGGVGVAIEGNILVRGKDPLRANGMTPCGECGVESRRVYVRGRGHKRAPAQARCNQAAAMIQEVNNCAPSGKEGARAALLGPKRARLLRSR